MKNLLIATALMASVVLGLSQTSEARVRVYLGVPHYDYYVGPGYIYRGGYGWYRPGPGYVAPGYYRISCGEARRIVRRSGYQNVSTIECNGRTYTFRAMRRGNPVTVFVNSRTGDVWRG